MSENPKRRRTELLEVLNSITVAKRLYRDRAADYVLSHPETFPDLISILFETEDPIHIRAAWTTELVFLRNPTLLFPQLDTFIAHIQNIKNDSALRPVAKVCQRITQLHYSKNGNAAILKEPQKDSLIEACFDWLLRDEKTATQVYAMSALAMFSNEGRWIREDLTEILKKDFFSKSPGYQSHARILLKRLSKK
jgi:hypothetical protein